MAELDLCDSCRRHVRRSALVCPFCGGRPSPYTPSNEDRRLAVRMGQFLLAGSAGAVVTLGACAVYGGPGVPCDNCAIPVGGTTSGGNGGLGGGTIDAAAGGAVSSCEDEVPPDGGDAGSLTCPVNSVPCGDVCAAYDDPAFGCGDASCQPCAPESQASTCSGGACVVSPCEPGLADCDANSANGCEVDVNADPQNCGACGHDCQGNACDNAGRCFSLELASSEGPIEYMASDETALFWLTPSSVMRFEKSTGALVAISENAFDPSAIAVDEGHVYFRESGSVMKLEKQGGQLAALTPNESFSAGSIAVDEAFVYWTDWLPCGNVSKISKNGGQKTVLISQQARPDAIAIDAEYVYWTNYSSGSINRISKTGANAKILVKGQQHARNIAVDETSLYFTISWPSTGAVRKVSLDGGTPITLANAQQIPGGIALDMEYVYWVTEDGRVMRVAKDGGPTFQLAQWSYGLWSIVVDSTSVFWGSGGSVLSAPK